MEIRNGNTFVFEEEFYSSQINDLLKKIEALEKVSKNKIILDFGNTRRFDNLVLATLFDLDKKENVKAVFSEEILKELHNFKSNIDFDEKTGLKISAFEAFVMKINDFFSQMKSVIILSADIFFYSYKSILSVEGRKKGSIYQQMLLIGNNAVPIIFLLSFLIGLILSIQSAAQLRQFGASIFLVDLIVIGMILEMGPIIAAVIVAGRSGSAIAAEISTMKITEELDALKVMAINPLKYVVAPKMIAMTVCLPMLTIIANMVGIFGGFIIGVLYLGLSPDIFINRALSVMTLYFWYQSMLKSVLFSWLIVIIGVHFGFNVKGGAEGVGKAATASVVAAIFSVIITDALLSLIFYFDW